MGSRTAVRTCRATICSRPGATPLTVTGEFMLMFWVPAPPAGVVNPLVAPLSDLAYICSIQAFVQFSPTKRSPVLGL